MARQIVIKFVNTKPNKIGQQLFTYYIHYGLRDKTVPVDASYTCKLS
jgi:hypothetical protein